MRSNWAASGNQLTDAQERESRRSMTTRFVDTGWSREFTEAAHATAGQLRIISPFIKTGALRRLLGGPSKIVSVITRFNLSDFAEGVSDIAALRDLVEHGASVRGIRNLHAKMYLFGSERAIVTSANLTEMALDRNQEFGLISQEKETLAACQRYFNDLWQRGGAKLTVAQLDDWATRVTAYRAEGGRPSQQRGLGDFGVDAGMVNPPPIILPIAVADSPQAFVKFLGEGDNRVLLSFSTFEQIRLSGCHWAVAYPNAKRPRSVEDDAVIFISRLTREPNDIRVFGRAIAMRHVPGRDDATQEDIALRKWKANWSRYIRVHHAEFVAGTLANGVSLTELMSALGSDSFASTLRNATRGEGNTDPRLAYQQQPAVQLSARGITWLGERFQATLDRRGKVPQDDLDKLDWPLMR
jgi:hypothetical protein